MDTKLNIIDVNAQTTELHKRKFPTEIIELPSKGLLYPSDHPLSTGEIEMRYMTTRDEDILTTTSYIKKGTVIDELLKSLIVTQFDYDTLLVGDRNALMVAAGKLGYGPEYKTTITSDTGETKPITINLDTDIKYVEFNQDLITPHQNLFKFETSTKDVIEFSLLTVGSSKILNEAVKKLNMYGGGVETKITTQMRYLIKSVNGNTDGSVIKEFADNMLARDSKLFREYIVAVQPDLDLDFETEDPETGDPFRGKIEIGIDIFYPNLRKK